jgi:hypothetical protein
MNTAAPKSVTVLLAGTTTTYTPDIQPGMTARALLKQLGIKGYLKKADEALPFGAREDLYPRVEDGEKLVATPSTPVAL